MFKSSHPRNEKPALDDIDYQFAIAELQAINSDKYSSIQQENEKKIALEEEEIRKKLVSEIEQEFQNTKKANEQLMKKQI